MVVMQFKATAPEQISRQGLRLPEAVPEYYFPVPARAEVSGLGIALLNTCRVAFRTPVADGVNVRLMVHEDRAATLPPQVVEAMVKSPALVPVTLIPPKVTDVFSRSLKVAVFATLVWPTTVLANGIVAGVSLTATVAVPVRLTDCGLLVALSVSVKAALLAPVVLGAKATLIWQEALAGMLDPRVLDEIRKSPGLAPVKPTLETVIAAVLVFLTVTVFAALVAPALVVGKANEEGETVKGPLPPVPTVIVAEAVTALLTVSVAVTD